MGVWLETIVGIVWGPALVAAIVGTGVWLTIRLGFPQFSGFKHAIQVVFGKFDDDREPGEISHFQALSAALSATVGLGNIAGVAIAISAGGPGALVWMWLIGFIGMATKCASCTLAVKYRNIDPEGHVAGGPMHYIEQGLGTKWRPMAMIFAGLVALASFGGGNMFQSNQVAVALHNAFGLNTALTGLVLAIGVAIVIVGGIKRIGQVAGTLVPFMCALYLLGSIAILISHWDLVPAAIALIFNDAFTGQAVAGGAVGEVIRQGVRRGTFSNESGLGSAPIAHAAAKTDHPTREGMVALLEPFIDTIVICSLTGLVIVTTGVYAPFGNVIALDSTHFVGSGPNMPVVQIGDELALQQAGQTVGKLTVESIDPTSHTLDLVAPESVQLASYEPLQLQIQGGVALTTGAFDQLFVGFGRYFVSLAVLLFAFSTMISWSYYGQQGVRYLFGAKRELPFKLIFVVAIFVGAVWNLGAVVNFSDIAYGLMAVPNLIALWLLSRNVRNEHQQYFAGLKQQNTN